LQSSPVVRFFDAARDGGVRPFGILANGRPDKARRPPPYDVLMALIEAPRAVVSKHALFEPRLAKHDRRQVPAVGHKTTALHKRL
jgi:hypothetical protein